MFSSFKMEAIRYLVCLAVCFGAVMFFENKTQKEPEPILIERQAEVKKEVVFKEKIVTKIVKPDGTTIEKVDEKEKTAKEDSKTVEKVPQQAAPTVAKKTQYSAEVKYLPSLYDKPSIKDVEVEGGFRLSSSDFWLTTSYNVKFNQVTVGIRYEW